MIISTDGDYGDLVYTLSVMSGVPDGPHKILARIHPKTKSKTQAVVDQLVKLLKPLVEAQPYISELRSWKDGDTRDWDSGGFRWALMHNPVKTLFSAYRQHFKSIHSSLPCGDGTTPWLTCGKSKYSSGRIVINRTDRYQNEFFPWPEIVKHYGNLLLFVGTGEEYQNFSRSFGEVEWNPTKNFLEVAELINGSELFIGNQSCANAIAEGLKHNMIQETSLDIPDCVFARPNAKHVFDGTCELPAIGDKPSKSVSYRPINIKDIDENTVPPRKWVVRLPNGEEERNTFLQTIIRVAHGYGMSKQEVLQQNAEEYREYYFRTCYESRFGTARTALSNSLR